MGNWGYQLSPEEIARDFELPHDEAETKRLIEEVERQSKLTRF
jgi:hypothetical protein